MHTSLCNYPTIHICLNGCFLAVSALVTPLNFSSACSRGKFLRSDARAFTSHMPFLSLNQQHINSRSSSSSSCTFFNYALKVKEVKAGKITLVRNAAVGCCLLLQGLQQSIFSTK